MHPFKVKSFEPTDINFQQDLDNDRPDPEKEAAARISALKVQEEETRALLEAAKREGFESGYKDGLAQVQREGAVAFEKSALAFQAEIEHLRGQRDDAIQAMSRGAVGAGVKIAESLMAATAIFDRQSLIDAMIREARGVLQPSQKIEVLANQAFFDLCHTIDKSIHRVEDPTMLPGGFIIRVASLDGQTMFHAWDASIERAIDALNDFDLTGGSNRE